MDYIIQSLLSSSTGLILTAISILIATFLGIRTLKENRKFFRQSHTIDILSSRFSEEKMTQYMNTLRTLKDNHEKLDGSVIVTELAEALNLYEFIAAAARMEILDSELIYQVRGGRMLKDFDNYKNYIDGRRKINNNHKIWEHLEWFIEEKVRPRR